MNSVRKHCAYYMYIRNTHMSGSLIKLLLM